jgi:DNA polymerase elongation subunit (family B)
LSYISAYHDKYASKILVWEKRQGGNRVRRELEPEYYFYEANRLGEHETITGVRCKRINCTSSSDFDQAVMSISPSARFESDFDPLERALMDHYSKLPSPKLAVGFLDIEVDYDEAIGFAGPANPYAPINALTLYHVDEKKYYTWALAPKSWVAGTALPEHLQYVKVCTDEKELLTLFLEAIHTVDVLSGWNSEFYDMPYIGKRIELIFGPHALSMLAFEGAPKPRWAEKPRFKHSKDMDQILELQSRVHLDYLALVRKFNLTTRQSFALNSVAMAELGEEKLHYDGSLSALYNNDFIKFLEYNKHDVTLLIRLDKKFNYIELANQMVHGASVNFKAIFGSVQLIDSSIINFAHNTLNKIVFDKQVRPEGTPVEGALVITPVPGFYEWIGACDINSLYPSAIRSLNLSPEKIVGQIKEHEAGWRAFYEAKQYPDDQAKQDAQVTVDLEGSSEELYITAGELVALCTESKYAVSGFGTILDQSSGEGILAAVLSYWFKGRKEMQAEKKKWGKEADKILAEGLKLSPEELIALQEDGLV